MEQEVSQKKQKHNTTQKVKSVLKNMTTSQMKALQKLIVNQNEKE